MLEPGATDEKDEEGRGEGRSCPLHYLHLLERQTDRQKQRACQIQMQNETPARPHASFMPGQTTPSPASGYRLLGLFAQSGAD